MCKHRRTIITLQYVMYQRVFQEAISPLLFSHLYLYLQTYLFFGLISNFVSAWQQQQFQCIACLKSTPSSLSPLSGQNVAAISFVIFFFSCKLLPSAPALHFVILDLCKWDAHWIWICNEICSLNLNIKWDARWNWICKWDILIEFEYVNDMLIELEYVDFAHSWCRYHNKM